MENDTMFDFDDDNPCDDYCDDFDEINYNPYMGCDEFDCENCDFGGEW